MNNMINFKTNIPDRKTAQKLRKMPLTNSASKRSFRFKLTAKELSDAKCHLNTIYQGKITTPFAAKMIILNELYGARAAGGAGNTRTASKTGNTRGTGRINTAKTTKSSP